MNKTLVISSMALLLLSSNMALAFDQESLGPAFNSTEFSNVKKQDELKNRIDSKRNLTSDIGAVEFDDDPVAIEERRIQREAVAEEKVTAMKEFISEISETSSEQYKVYKAEEKAVTNSQGTTSEQTKVDETKNLAGFTYYATLITEADSYVPGPVIAQVEEGPFAGARLIGKFKQAPDNEHLILEFTQASHQHKLYSVKAVAVDDETQLAGVQGEVDSHIFTRRILPFATSFLAGAAELVKNRGTQVSSGITTAITHDDLSDRDLVLGMTANAAKQLNKDMTPKGVRAKPQVRLARGTEMGVFFIQNAVTKRRRR